MSAVEAGDAGWPLPAELPADLFCRARAASCRFRPGQPADFDAHQGLLLPSELNRAVAKRQAEFLAGRWCVDQLYRGKQLSLPLPGYRGQGPPDWPAGWIGSISHSQDRAAACLAGKGAVNALGIDLEFLMAPETAIRIRSSILRPEEEPLLAVDPILTLTLIFSFKESIYKAFNPLFGRFFGFEEVAVRSIAADRICFEPRGELARELPSQAPLEGHWARQGELLVTAYEWPAG